MAAKPNLSKGTMILLTCSRGLELDRARGYVGDVFEDRFEFHEVTNPYEHFSNISDPPILKTHVVLLRDIESIGT